MKERLDLLNASILTMGLGKMFIKNNEVLDKIVNELLAKNEEHLLFEEDQE